jgi:hypothetical protein
MVAKANDPGAGGKLEHFQEKSMPRPSAERRRLLRDGVRFSV